jgi:hypothetical protein
VDEMNKYKIKRSDCKPARVISAESPGQAVRLAAGEDFYSGRLVSWREDGSAGTWRVNLRAGKKDKTGGQPVVERTFYVETA